MKYLIALLLLLVPAVAFAATSLSFTNTFRLNAGSYCLNQTNELVGNKLKVKTTVVSGECSGTGQTIVVP